jgi:hypothetical protein
MRSVTVDYADAMAAFFVPRQEGTELPVAVTGGSPARRLRDACEPVARLEGRGWVRDGALTGEGLAERLGIEQRTDAQEQPIVAALGGQIDEVCSRLNHWGQLCIEAGAFPPDILKRAAG